MISISGYHVPGQLTLGGNSHRGLAVSSPDPRTERRTAVACESRCAREIHRSPPPWIASSMVHETPQMILLFVRLSEQLYRCVKMIERTRQTVPMSGRLRVVDWQGA